MSEKIVDEDYIDLIISNNLVYKYEAFGNPIRVNNRFSIISVPSQIITDESISQYYYYSFPSIFTPESITAYEDIALQAVRTNPYLNLYGQGVLVGFIDTGIDYMHQAFINADGTTRIVSIWDQTIQTGEPPSGYNYGSEYTREMINTALKNSNPREIVPTTDDVGHGTMIAGVACGNDNSDIEFLGIAPLSSIVTVKLKPAKRKLLEIFHLSSDTLCYQESDILLAIKYINEVAIRLSLPFVICFSLGTSQGGHDGFGATSTFLSELTTIPGNCVTTSAGNEGSRQRHYHGFTNSERLTDTFELKVDPKDKLFNLEIWNQISGKASIQVVSPTGELSPVIQPVIGKTETHNYTLCSTTIYINNIITETETGTQLILIRFTNACPGIWNFRVSNINSNAITSFDSWLPGSTFISDETYFIESTPYTTITSPGNAFLPITVTAYDPVSTGIYYASSRGNTRIGLTKPDIACPGVNILSPAPNNRYVSASGSSIASAIMAGSCALALEWTIGKNRYPNVNGVEIKTIFTRGAIESSILQYPNRIWGYGKLDLTNFFEELSQL